ncbi:hypothetical protein BUE80_DR011754 [Diplocarpon rosae]|nr:hypothetical protein BUE80_DR011754 [Diplocarpon rosae]
MTPTPSTKSVCYTQNGLFPVKTVKTAVMAATSTLRLTEVVIYTPTVTKQPPPVTSNITVTSSSTITVSSITFEGTLTFTEYTGSLVTISSAIATNVQIDTSSTTSTISVPVTTIPTPSGFQPVQSTIPSAVPKRDIEPLSRIKRDLVPPRERRTFFTIAPALPKKGTRTWFSYPTFVTCYQIVTVYNVVYTTRTAGGATTVMLPADVVTRGVTSYTTLTSVIDASATTTITLSQDGTTTAYFTASTTTSTTVTVTETRALATAYAACSPQNILGSVNNQGIWEVHVSAGSADPASIPYTNASTAGDCCTSCFANADCAGYVFSGSSPTGQQCLIILLNPGTCAAPGTYGLGINTGGGYQPDEGYIVGNGYCGAVTGLNNS